MIEFKERVHGAKPSKLDGSEFNILNVGTNFIPIYNDLHIKKALSEMQIDQGRSASCVGQVLAKLLNLLYLDVEYKFSPWWLWVNRPTGLNKLLKTEGTQPKAQASKAKEDGSCYLSSYNLDSSKYLSYKDLLEKFENTIYPNFISEAKYYRPDYYIMPKSRNDIKETILKSKGVGFMIPIYPSFSNASATGNVQIPLDSEQLIGYHEVLCYGWNDTTKMWLCANSYGENWGDEGFFTLPYYYEIRETIAFIDDSKIHWGDRAFYYLNTHGIKVHERNFNEPITRAEVMALIARMKGMKI